MSSNKESRTMKIFARFNGVCHSRTCRIFGMMLAVASQTLVSGRERIRGSGAGNGQLADGRGAGIVASGRSTADLAAVVDRSAAPTRFQPRDGRVPRPRHALERPGPHEA